MRAKLKTSEFFSKLVVLTHDKGMISQTLKLLIDLHNNKHLECMVYMNKI